MKPENEKTGFTTLKEIVACLSCGKVVARNESLSDFRLKDKTGKYIRYCKAPECAQAFEKALQFLDNPTGMIFNENTEVELGEKDPYFKIKYDIDKNGAGWHLLSLEEPGGLLVFIRKCIPYMEKTAEGKTIVKCKVKITKKSQRCAFAEPYFQKICPIIESKKIEEKQ